MLPYDIVTLKKFLHYLQTVINKFRKSKIILKLSYSYNIYNK